jgi:UDP-glucose 4-epimerase
VVALDAKGHLPWIKLEQERTVGHEAADGGEVELEQAVEPEPARDALVGDGRVEIAIADHRSTALERGPDHLVHELGSSGDVQERLAPWADVPSVQDEIADALAELGPARLARGDDVDAVRLEPPAQKLGLGRLPRAVEALEGHEHARHPMAVRRMRTVRAIVTGGAGFIGSHVVDALVTRGDQVAVIDSLVHGTKENVQAAAELHVRDIREPLDDLFDSVRPDAVFHLAAQADVRVSVENPVEDADVNVVGTIRILEGARRHGAQVVFASTGGAIYGECEEPAREDGTVEPLSPYGTSKLAAEEYLRSYNRLYGTRHIALRYGNVYGPRQDPHGEAGVVAIFLGALSRGEQATIFGDGSQTRDYVYVGDVARATTSTVGQDHGVFNVGTGHETSVVELYELCARVAGSDVVAQEAPARLGELQRSFLDPTRAAHELGFTAMVDLEDGLRATWKWVQKE